MTINRWRKYYSQARQRVEELGFLNEIEWQASQQPAIVSESVFLREAAWVVMCSGFRESTVRKWFDYVTLCFCEWESAKVIADNSKICVESALVAFRNRSKMEALGEIAELIACRGFDNFFGAVTEDYLTELQKLPFIGPITALHLAKNLGFEIAKPDRHLVRLCSNLGFLGVEEMCEVFSSESGDPIRVVDIVLWRYCEQSPHSAFHEAEIIKQSLSSRCVQSQKNLKSYTVS